jgi:hypothetical protein
MSKSLFRAAMVIYGTLFLLLIFIPQALLNWTEDLRPTKLRDRLTAQARQIAWLSDRLALDKGYVALRGRFLDYMDQR